MATITARTTLRPGPSPARPRPLSHRCFSPSEVVLRSTVSLSFRRRRLALSLLITGAGAAVAACARPAATGAGVVSAPAPAPAPASANAAADDPSEGRVHLVADSLRARILARADWSDAPDSCDPGVLRTFSADTSSTLQGVTTADVKRLEEIVVAYGLDTPLDTPAGHKLLGAVVAWEAGAGNLRWDGKPGEAGRRALAPGLGGRFRNPLTKRCERYVQGSEATVVIPAVAHFAAPTVTGVRLRLVSGEAALVAVRTAAVAAAKPLSYVQLGPVVLWRDYALVSTRRLTEGAPAGELSTDVGNASYLLHRGADGWRLLVIARTW